MIVMSSVSKAAVLAEGTTVIENAAREPDIVQLCEMLNMMGANISGLNTSTLTIGGVSELFPTEITVIPDRIETGTFLMAGAALGDITLNHAEPHHLQTVLDKLEECGANYSTETGKIHIKKADEINAVDVTTDVYPGFPTDLQAQWMALMCAANSQSVVTDTVNMIDTAYVRSPFSHKSSQDQGSTSTNIGRHHLCSL